MDMKRSVTLFLVIIMVVAALGGCRSRTDLSEGSVILTVSDFDELPVRVSVAAGPYDIGEVVVRNIAKDTSGTTSDLQSVELRAYEVRYSRRDTGRTVPPAMVQSIFGLIDVGGSTTLNNLPFLTDNQLRNSPLLDLATTGTDKETGSEVIVLNVSLRFFGRTLAGDDVATDPASFTIEVVP
jgi:hypothetical protein